MTSNLVAIVSLKCPNCGGSLEFDNECSFGFCMYCGNKITIQQDLNYIHIERSYGSQIDRLVKQIETSLSIKKPFDALITINELKKIDSTFPILPLLHAKAILMVDYQDKGSISLFTECEAEEDLNDYFRYTSVRVTVDDIVKLIDKTAKSVKTAFCELLNKGEFVPAARLLEERYSMITTKEKQSVMYLPSLFEMMVDLYEKCAQKIRRIPIEIVKTKLDDEFGRVVNTDDDSFLRKVSGLKNRYYVYCHENPSRCVFADKKTVIGKAFSKVTPVVEYGEIMRDSLLYHMKNYPSLPRSINRAISICYDGFEPGLFPILTFCMKQCGVKPEDLDDDESWRIHGYKFSEFYYREEARHGIASLMRKTEIAISSGFVVNYETVVNAVKDYHSMWNDPIEKKGVFGMKTIPHPLSNYTYDEIKKAVSAPIVAHRTKYWCSPFDQYFAVLDFSYEEKTLDSGGE